MMTLFLLVMILSLMIFWLLFDHMHATQTRKIQKAIAARDYRTAASCMQGKMLLFFSAPSAAEK